MTYLSYSDTRKQLRHMLDAAASGVPVGIKRHDSRIVLVELTKLQEILESCPQLGRPQAVAEAVGWSVFLPGTPIAADGADLDEALDEFILALREYAEDWEQRLMHAPNHSKNWPVVFLVSMSSDSELADWIRGNHL